jgi:ferritin-like metal-binding protein YciE
MTYGKDLGALSSDIVKEGKKRRLSKKKFLALKKKFTQRFNKKINEGKDQVRRLEQKLKEVELKESSFK